MFERTLESLIKGFRSHRGKDEAAYLATVLGEIRQEIRGGDMEVKAEGILKLIYVSPNENARSLTCSQTPPLSTAQLQMLGHMSSKAAFHIVEVMAATKYHLKYIGYLGAAQCLERGTDVIILATNLIKKVDSDFQAALSSLSIIVNTVGLLPQDLTSRSDLDIMAALAGLSHLMTPELAQHFANDIIAMLNHSKPAIRKKAVVALHSILVHDPESLDKAWTRLQDRLEDSDQGVVSATVSILCELARKDPSPFLPLAPQLFQLLTSSTNNWVLIKVVKLFGALSTCEPRLSKRLLPPITSIIAQTPAMSLLYECIHTIIVGDMLSHAGGDQLAQTCVDKLSQFIADTDQNLKFIALVALIKILPSHPELVMPHREAIADLLRDEDSSVRLRALTLLSGLATKDNFSEFCLLLEKAIDGSDPASKPAPSAADALRGILAQSDSKGDSATANPTRSYSVSAQRAFLREGAMCVAVVAAKDNYSRVSNLQEYLELLLRLYPTAARPFKIIAERVVIDLVRRHPEHADALMRVNAGHWTNQHLRLCALRASLSSRAHGVTRSRPILSPPSSCDHVSLQAVLDSAPASERRDADHGASLLALARRHRARGIEDQQRVCADPESCTVESV